MTQTGTNTVGAPPAGRRPGWLPRGRGALWFGIAGLVNATGTGFFYPYQLLFFHAVLGLSLTTIDACLTIAALIVLPVLPRVGRLVDRVGPRPVLIAAALLRAGAFAGYLLIHQAAVFVLLAVLVSLCQRAEQTASPVLAGGAAPEGELRRWLGLSKVVFNAGIGLGGLLAGVVIAMSASHTAYVVVGVVNAVSFVFAAALYLPLPSTRHAPRDRTRTKASPWRDSLYLRVAVANFALMVVIVATEAGLPVYVVDNLDAPAWTVGLLFAVNTAMVVTLQLPLGRRVESIRPTRVVAVGLVLQIGLLVVLASVLGAGGPVRLTLLIGAMAVYTFGEMMAAQALAALLVALAPPEERGAYQALNQIAVGAAVALVPLFVTVTLAHGTVLLWWILSGMAVLAAADVMALQRSSGARLEQAVR